MHFLRNNLFSECQYGFQSSTTRPTSHALVNFIKQKQSVKWRGGGRTIKLVEFFIRHFYYKNLKLYGFNIDTVEFFKSYLSTTHGCLGINIGGNYHYH